MSELKSKFPLSYFPESLAEILAKVSEIYSYPLDYVCCSVLSASATAIGNSNAIHIKNNWIEKSSLFIAMIGSPGVNKSAPLTWAMMPIEKKEKDLYKQYLRNLKDYDQLPAKERDQSIEPILVKTVISDATPEAVVQQLKHNDRGILILMDELAGFLNTFQRYAKGNDEQFYLSAWSGKSVIVDRKTSRSIRINDPIINIIGTIQPGVLEKSFNGKDESGFFDRWLLCHPPDAKKGYWSDYDIDMDSQETYERIIENLMSLNPTIDMWENIIPNRMTYSLAGIEILKKWQRVNTDNINGTTEDVNKAIRSKIETYVHRLALIAELIDHAAKINSELYMKPCEISAQSVRNAVDLCEYFIRMGTNVRSGDPTQNLPLNFKNLLDIIPFDTEFTFDKFIEYAEYLEIPGSTARKWLRKNTGDNKIFIKIKHGFYARQ